MAKKALNVFFWVVLVLGIADMLLVALEMRNLPQDGGLWQIWYKIEIMSDGLIICSGILGLDALCPKSRSATIFIRKAFWVNFGILVVFSLFAMSDRMPSTVPAEFGGREMVSDVVNNCWVAFLVAAQALQCVFFTGRLQERSSYR